MNVTITAINQTYSLSGGEVSFTATIKLPSGKYLIVPIGEAETNQIISESQSDEEVRSDTTEEQVTDQSEALLSVLKDKWDGSVNTEVEFTPVDVPEQYESRVEEGVVEWEKLPDNQLTPQMKGILRKSGVNKFLSIEDLNALKTQILETLNKQPKAGKVNWNEGQKHPGAIDAWSTFNTVPKDEFGNPRPPGGIIEADPGESAEDDDGVGQL